MIKSIINAVFGAVRGAVSQVALAWAGDREVLPSGLSSRDQREAFSAGTRARSVFSARTTSARYLQEVKDSVDLLLQGGYETDLPFLRMRLRELITRLGYTPESGFPGDETLDIPPAEAGSLRDLGSRRRVDLMLETQISLARSAGQRQRGLEAGRKERWPAWELVRVFRRDVPRGSAESASQGWGGRWLRAGGPILESGRLVAMKDDPVWRNLGDEELFDDAIGVDHPPFAYNSGMRWVEIAADEAKALGLTAVARASRPVASQAPAEVMPDPEVSLRGLDPELARKLIERIKAKRAVKPDHVRFSEMLTTELSAAKKSYQGGAN